MVPQVCLALKVVHKVRLAVKEVLPGKLLTKGRTLQGLALKIVTQKCFSLEVVLQVCFSQKVIPRCASQVVFQVCLAWKVSIFLHIPTSCGRSKKGQLAPEEERSGIDMNYPRSGVRVWTWIWLLDNTVDSSHALVAVHLYTPSLSWWSRHGTTILQTLWWSWNGTLILQIVGIKKWDNNPVDLMIKTRDNSLADMVMVMKWDNNLADGTIIL